MRRRLLRALLVSVAGVVLLVVGAAISLANLDVDRYRDTIAERLSGLSGREVVIDGPIELELSLRPSLSVRDIRLRNAPWSEHPDMLVVAQAELRVAALPLLSGQLRARSVLFREVRVLLERDAAGAANWQLWEPAVGAGAAGAQAPPVLVDSLRMERLQLRYLDPARGLDLAVHFDEVVLAAAERDGPLTVAARGALGGGAMQVNLQLHTLADLLAGRATALDAMLGMDGVELRAAGYLPVADERHIEALGVSLRAPDLAALQTAASRVVPAATGIALPVLAPVVASAMLEASVDTVTLHDLAVQAGDAALAGELSVTLAERTYIEADLHGDHLDLDDFYTATAGAPGAPLFDDTPLPWSALSALDADLSLSLQRLDIGALVIGQPSVAMSLHDGVATAKPVLTLAGGSLHGELRASVEARQVGLTLAGRDIGLGELATTLGAGGELHGAPARITLEISSYGETTRQLAAGAAGRSLLEVGPGRVPSRALSFAGGDLLVELVRVLGIGGPGELHLECGVVNFSLRGGVASGEQAIGMRFDRMNLVGGGSIDLGRETLDLHLVPEPRQGMGLAAGSTLAGMVAVRGTLREPSLEVSGKGLAKAGAKVGAAVITGGLSILAGALFERLTADDDPCTTALGASTGNASPAAESGGKPSPEPSVSRPKSKRDD